MKNLIPGFILSNYKDNIFNGDFDAYTVFIDLSGFTKMSQDLMQHQKEGSELLCHIINRVFSSAIDSIYRYGGFISGFAGDSFTAIFSKDISDLDFAINACLEMKQNINEIQTISTKYGNFIISVKIGVSEGTVKWRILKTDLHYCFYFRGEGIDNAARSEQLANKNDIITDKRVHDKLLKRDKEAKFASAGKDHYKVLKYKHAAETKSPQTTLGHAFADRFLPVAVRNMKVAGEFRELISLFLSFKEDDNFIDGITKAINLSKIYGAYLKQIDFGDKGGTLLFFFGAPVSMEQLFERAANFALECLQIKELKCRMALTFDIAFAGFIGSELRSEFGALGNVVNKSARLAMHAKWNEIFIDEHVYDKIKNKYLLQFAGSKYFKGFDDKINFYKLLKKTDIYQKTAYKGKIFGRDTELEFLANEIDQLKNNKFQGIIYINGEAGIGKSRLAFELKNMLKDDYIWVYMPCDPIIKNSFNPIIYFLKSYFSFSEDKSSEDAQDRFESKMKEIINLTNDLSLKSELIRTRPIIAGLLGLNCRDPLYDQLNAKGKYTNIIFSVKNLLKALSLIKPVIMEIDDGQWVDPDTLQFLKSFVFNIEAYPIIIITECRFRDDGQRIDFDLGNIRKNFIDLNFFDKQTIRGFMLYFFNVPEIKDKALDYICKYTSGNPFFLEQILSFILENGLIKPDGNILFDNIHIPSDINALILARIDRLSEDLKDIIKTASVLGIEFPVKLLENMFSGRRIDSKIKKVEKEQIWLPLNQLTYIFKHVLIRESVYNIQLADTLKKLHDLAAETIKIFYKDKIKAYYPVLADHYERSENIKEARNYLKLSIGSFKKEFKNKQALEYSDRLYKYAENETERISILISKLYLLHYIGKLKEAETIGQNALKKSQDINSKGLVLTAHLGLGKTCNYLYDIDNSLYHLDYIMSNASPDNPKELPILAEACRVLGRTHHLRGHLKESYSYYQKALSIFKEIDNKEGLAHCYNDIGIFCGREIGLDKVLDYLQSSYDIFRWSKNLENQLAPLSNIALTYYEIYLDLEKSNQYYETAIKLAQKIGSYRNLMVLYLNLGENHTKLGILNKAEELTKKALEFSNEMNDFENASLCNINLSEIYCRRKNYTQAIHYIDTAIDIVKAKRLNLRLIDFYNFKVLVLIEMEKFNEALALFNDIKSLAVEFDIKDMHENIIITELMVKYLQNDRSSMKDLLALTQKDLSKTNKANIYFFLWKQTNKDEYRIKAYQLYEHLTNDITEDYKEYTYVERLKELRA